MLNACNTDRMKNISSLIILVSLVSVISLAAACGDDPVSYSEPVGLELKIESGKVVNSSVSGEKSITTESGNPYGAFVNAAKAELGREPARIVLTSATLVLGAMPQHDAIIRPRQSELSYRLEPGAVTGFAGSG